MVVLDAALGRRLRFLANFDQFRPWPRRILVRLYGALPVYYREDHADYVERNQEVFAKCEALFDQGEAVAIFPEGASRGDRALLPLKRGAARLALAHASRESGAHAFSLLPVGIHYSSITDFRADVTVSVGEPIPRAELASPDSVVTDKEVARLTERVAGELRAHLVDIQDPRRAALFEALARIAATGEGAIDLDSARALARRLEDLHRTDPAGYARVEADAIAFERVRSVLRVPPSAFHDPPRAGSAGRVAALAAGAIPAAVGLAVHALPLWLTRSSTLRYSFDPSQVSFARIASGFWLLLITYLIGGGALALALGSRWPWLLPILSVSALTGLFLVKYAPLARRAWDLWRLRRLERTDPHVVRGARAARDRLLRFVDGESPAIRAKRAGTAG